MAKIINGHSGLKALPLELGEAVPAEEVAYCRVSTGRDQDPDFQIALMKKRGIPDDNIFVETKSGRSMNRNQFKLAKMMLRPGWTLVVWKLDRLGRNALGLMQLAAEFQENGWNLVSLTEQLDSRTPFGKFYFAMLASLAELESNMTAERTAAGMARKRELGMVLGRRTRIKPDDFETIEKLLLADKLTIPEIGKRFKLSGSTVNHHFPGWRSKSKSERLAWRRVHPLPIK